MFFFLRENRKEAYQGIISLAQSSQKSDRPGEELDAEERGGSLKCPDTRRNHMSILEIGTAM